VSFPSDREIDRSSPTLAAKSPPHSGVAKRAIDPFELYAAGIDTSDYVTRVAPLICRVAGDVGDLLDIGAGGGQLGRALRVPGRRWTAIEPSSSMRARLARLHDPPQLDLLRTFAVSAGNWRWTALTNAYHHFHMVDRGAPVAAGSTRPVRIYEYEAAIGTRFGQGGSGEPWRDWNFQILGNLRGPMWYNTEERLLLPGQQVNVTVYRKNPFWVWGTRYEVEAARGVTLFAAVNNIFDINQHPIFIALDRFPCIADPRFQNGACGNSMPGREFIVGIQGRW